jgi:microcystin-dependent protein
VTYTPTTWVDGTTPINAANLNKIEQALDTADDSIQDHSGRINAVEAEVDTKMDQSLYGIPTGVATLDATGKVPAAQLPSVAGIPIGGLVMWAGTTAPAGGWLLCDGSAVSRTTYATLFSVIGTAYGPGDGTTTFNLPDLRGRMPVGLGTHADVDVLGDNDGAALANRRAKHKHTVNDAGHGHSISDPGHTHTLPSEGGSLGGTFLARAQFADFGSRAVASAPTGVSVTSGPTGVTVGPQATSPTDGPAYLTVNFLIKA